MELQPFTRGAAAPGTWCCSPWHTRLQVIRRKPEEFKIACLLDLRSLWPAEHSPFYAGFGNRDSDHTAYAAAGVPPARILIINPKGEIRHSSRTYCWASYPRLLQLAREMFPPIDTEEEQVEEDYTSFNYWKRPVAAMPVPAVAPPAEAPTTGAAIGTEAAAASNAAPAAAAATAAVRRRRHLQCAREVRWCVVEQQSVGAVDHGHEGASRHKGQQRLDQLRGRLRLLHE